MMKKTLFQKVILFAVVFVLLMPVAMADMQRGDRSDDVQQLQELLLGTGWLFELPDGVFGRNTEQAVKNFENYAGLPVDGIADDEMLRALIASWESLNGMRWTGYGAEEVESESIPPACCIVRHNGETSYTEYCDTHQPMEEYTLLMLESDDVEEVKQASLTWQWEVERLYDRWIELLPEDEKGVVIANKATFFANIDAQRRVGAMGVQTPAKAMRTEVGIMENLRSQVEWLCGVVWELENMNGCADKPVRVSSSAIIEGATIYYSGSVDGTATGIFAMDLNGENVRLLVKGMAASLEAVSNGNLLVYSYDWETLLLIKTDGTMMHLNEGDVERYNGHAIAYDGYFYWNRYKIAEDGSEWMDVIPPTAENNGSCYPVAVDGEYLYFMDNSKYNDSGVFYESNILPPGAALSRVQFGTGVVERLSEEGTRFIGIEDGMAYYTRQNFYMMDLDGDWIELETDQGLYCMNLEALAETQLSEIVPDEDVFDYYELLQNGIIYGLRADYTKRSDGWGDMSIIRMTVGGQMLAPIAVDSPNGLTAFGVVNGVYYGGYVEYMDSDYAQSMDCIYMYNLKDGGWTLMGLDNNCSMFYGEFDPSIAVIDGNIYYEAMDNDSYVVQLRKLNIEDGTDIVLAKGMDY